MNSLPRHGFVGLAYALLLLLVGSLLPLVSQPPPPPAPNSHIPYHLRIKEAFIASDHHALDTIINELSRSSWADTLALAWHRKGGLWGKQGDFLQAIACTRRALQLRQQHLPPKSVPTGLSHYNLGVFYKELGIADSATTHLMASIRIFDTTLATDDMIDALQVLGNLYYQTGEYERARVELQKAATLAVAQGNTFEQAQSYNDLAIVLNSMDRKSEARQYARRTIDIYRGLEGESGEFVNSVINFANAFIDDNNPGDLALASEYLEQALKSATSNRDTASIIRIYNNIGVVQKRKGALSQARSAIERALLLAQHFYGYQPHPEIAIPYNNLGDVLLQSGEHPKALQAYHTAVALIVPNFANAALTFTDLPSKDQLAACPYKTDLLGYLTDLGVAWAVAPKNGSEALQHALRIFHLADALVDLMRRDQQAQYTKLFWREKIRPLYQAAVAATYQLGDYRQAFFFIEKSKSALLLDALRHMGARNAIPDTLRMAEADLKYRLTQAELDNSSQAELLRQEYQRLTRQLELNYPRYYQLKYDTTVVTLPTLQQYLQKQSATFVGYFSSDEALYSLHIAPDTVVFTKTDTAQVLPSVRTWLYLLTRPNDLQTRSALTRFEQASHRLYTCLLHPIHSRSERLKVSPDGYINYLPFEALLTTPQYAPSRLLLQQHAVVYAYSATIFLQHQWTKAATSPETFTGFAPVEFKAHQMATLQGTAESIERLRDLGRIYSYQEASKSQFMRQAPRSSIVHLYTHATASGSQPAIYFADSLLYLSEVYALQLNAQLVTLTGCETAAGNLQTGEGIMSLARSFAFAGSPATVATLWEVNEVSTVQITELFYRYLRQGLHKDQALRQAKLDYLNTTEAVGRLPYYWAGMILVGSDAPIRWRGNSWPQWMWYALGVGLLVTASAIMGRKRHQ